MSLAQEIARNQRELDEAAERRTALKAAAARARQSPDHVAAAKSLGIKVDEVGNVDRLGGRGTWRKCVVATTTDGQRMIFLPEDKPDAIGQTGWRLLEATASPRTNRAAGVFTPVAPPEVESEPRTVDDDDDDPATSLTRKREATAEAAEHDDDDARAFLAALEAAEADLRSVDAGELHESVRAQLKQQRDSTLRLLTGHRARLRARAEGEQPAPPDPADVAWHTLTYRWALTVTDRSISDEVRRRRDWAIRSRDARLATFKVELAHLDLDADARWFEAHGLPIPDQPFTDTQLGLAPPPEAA